MQRAMDETERRRHKQLAYNKEHSIIPRSITKAVADIMEGVYSTARVSPKTYAKVAEEVEHYGHLSQSDLVKKVAQLEQQMYTHAQNLEFEEAARLRDEIHRIQTGQLGLFEKASGT